MKVNNEGSEWDKIRADLEIRVLSDDLLLVKAHRRKGDYLTVRLKWKRVDGTLSMTVEWKKRALQ